MLTLKGLKETIENIDKFKNQKEQRAKDILVENAKDLSTEARRRVPIDLGNLKASIQYYISKNGTEADITAEEKYASAVEFGTSPHFPPIQALEGWAGRKGIPAFLVARKISKEGTPAQPFMRPAFEKIKPKFVKALVRLMRYV